MIAQTRRLPVPSLLLALCACDPEPIYEPTCDDGLVAPVRAPDPVVGEDNATFAAGEEAAVSDDGSWSMSPRSAVAADGSAWISWYSWEDSGIVFRAQRLDASGAPTLGEKGLLVSDEDQATWVMDHSLLVADNGDAIVVFADERTGYRDLHAYRITPEGELAWGADGVTLSDGDDGGEGTPRATLLADGDLGVVWTHDDGRDDVSTVRALRLSEDGEPRWPDPIELDCGEGYCSDAVVAPMEGSDLVVVYLESAELMTDERDVRAHRLDANGCPVWDADPVLDGDAGVPYYKGADVLATPRGLYVAWTALSGSRSMAATVQRVDADGSLAFGDDGLRLSTTSERLQLDPHMALDASTGELVVAWTEANSAQRRFGLTAQRVDADGARLWGDDGLEIEPLSPTCIGAIALRAWGDRALLWYGDQPTDIDGFSGLETRLGLVVLDGETEVERATISETASGKANARVSETSEAGRWWLTWADDRADDGDVYAAGTVAE